MNCPMCDGAGEVSHNETNDPQNDTSGVCDLCKGEGVASDEDILELDEGCPSRYCSCNQCWDGDYDAYNDR